MMHEILARIDDLDAAIAAADMPLSSANTHRSVLSAFKRDIFADLKRPAPGSTSIEAGATITHRPDLAYDERARQAAMQGDSDLGIYLPLQKDTTTAGAGGTVQAPDRSHPAEEAKIGTETR